MDLSSDNDGANEPAVKPSKTKGRRGRLRARRSEVSKQRPHPVCGVDCFWLDGGGGTQCTEHYGAAHIGDLGHMQRAKPSRKAPVLGG